MESILNSKIECLVCKTTKNLNRHHIYYGVKNRDNSEKYGCVVWLCREHHIGQTGVHFNPEFNDQLKMACQLAFEKRYPELDFVKIFGKNYI